MIVMIPKSLFCHGIRQLAVRQRCLLQAGIHAGLIQRQWIKGCKHTDIRQNRSIVLEVAVTVRERYPLPEKYGNSVCRPRQPSHILPCGS